MFRRSEKEHSCGTRSHIHYFYFDNESLTLSTRPVPISEAISTDSWWEEWIRCRDLLHPVGRWKRLRVGCRVVGQAVQRRLVESGGKK